MLYKEIVSVTGLSGLYQLISSKQDGAIVRSLEDKSTKFAASRNHHFTPLESIEVFTTGENTNLSAVFKAIQEKEAGHPLPGTAAADKLVKDYFKAVFPEFDQDKVYVSDMKKMIKWYGILKANDLLKFEETETDENNPAGPGSLNERKTAEPKPVIEKKPHLPAQKRQQEKGRANRKTGG